MAEINKVVDLKTAFRYPFNRPKGLLSILWIAVPAIIVFILAYFEVSFKIRVKMMGVFGAEKVMGSHVYGLLAHGVNYLALLLLALGTLIFAGYKTRIIREFIKGEFKELPMFIIKSDFKLGFFMLIKALPFWALYIILTLAVYFSSLFAGMYAVFVFESIIVSGFCVPILTINYIKKGTVASYFEFRKVISVFDNFNHYIIALLKSIALGMIFLAMSLVLVGIPALFLTRNLFIADFYRKYSE